MVSPIDSMQVNLPQPSAPTESLVEALSISGEEQKHIISDSGPISFFSSTSSKIETTAKPTNDKDFEPKKKTIKNKEKERAVSVMTV